MGGRIQEKDRAGGECRGQTQTHPRQSTAPGSPAVERDPSRELKVHLGLPSWSFRDVGGNRTKGLTITFRVCELSLTNA